MDDEMDVMGLLRSLQREMAKNKLSPRDISQIIFQWYLKKMGFIQVDDEKFELRALGMNTPFEFKSRIDDYIVGLTRLNNPHYTSASHGFGFHTWDSLNLEESRVERYLKKLRDEMKRLHSNLRKVWEDIEDDDTTSEVETE
ncbi:uncharacterized protein LOC135835172 [Planococcus citri]|uniref:uncharacterized protein LOC135835172 n=1 Tax=Planococcus citri TaxID=170843 RepID=UPI0031F90898